MSNVSYILVYNGTFEVIDASDEEGLVNHTVSSLTAGEKYTFSLYSLFEGIISSGVRLTAATGKMEISVLISIMQCH